MEESDAILASGIYLKKTNNSHMIYFETIKPDGTMRKNTINCATAAVIAWQRMGAKGQWGVREGGEYILFEAKLKARNPKESTPLNNIRWKKTY